MESKNTNIEKAKEEYIFDLLGGKIEFTRKQKKFIELRSYYEGEADKMSRKYANLMKGWDWSEFVSSGIQFGYEIIEAEISNIHKLLVRNGLYDISLQGIKDDFHEIVLEPWDEVADAALEVVNKTKETYNEMVQARELRKATRSQVVGGGFGVKGAVKGMAFAGAANAVTGLGHSVANSIGNHNTKVQLQKMCEQNYRDPEFQSTVKDTIARCIGNVWAILFAYNQDEYEMVGDDEDRTKAFRLLDNIAIIPKEDQKNILREVFQLDPINPEIYLKIMNLGDQYLRELNIISKKLGTYRVFNMIKRIFVEDLAGKLNEKTNTYRDAKSAIQQVEQERKKLEYDEKTGDNEQLLIDKKQELFEKETTVRGVCYNDLEKAEKVRNQQKIAGDVVAAMQELSYEELLQKRELLRKYNQDPVDSIKEEWEKFEPYFEKLDKEEKIFQGHLYETVEQCQKAEKDYETLTKEIDLKDITWEKADQYIKNLSDQMEYDENVRKIFLDKLEKIRQNFEEKHLEKQIIEKYGEIDVSGNDPESLAKYKKILNQIYEEFGENGTCPQIERLQQAINESEYYINLANQEKVDTVATAAGATGKSVGYVIGGIIAVLLCFRFIPSPFCWIGLVIIGIVVKESIGDRITDVSNSVSKNKRIDEAKQKVRAKHSNYSNHRQQENVNVDGDTIFCTECGKKINVEAAFCPHCGKKNAHQKDNN